MPKHPGKKKKTPPVKGPQNLGEAIRSIANQLGSKIGKGLRGEQIDREVDKATGARGRKGVKGRRPGR